MKVTLLGGGGFRTPLTFAALQRAAQRLDLHELVLHDLNASRLRRMTDVLNGLQPESAVRLGVTATTDLAEAVRGATVVLCAIRVGGLEGRVVDERVPLGEGIIGQETVGPGGLCLVLRSVAVLSGVAEVVAREAPTAWFINFTNPVGVLSGVLRDVLGERVVGVCDTPSSLCRRVAPLLERPPAELTFDYFGLNHLGWVRSIRDPLGRDVLPGLLADDAALARLDEGQLFGAECLRELGMLPSEYLSYYYFPQRQIQAVAAAGYTRAELLQSQQHAFYADEDATPDDALRAWQSLRAERDRSYMADARPRGAIPDDLPPHDPTDGYASVAVSVIEALENDAQARLIVNHANHGRLPFLADDVVVELPCQIGSSGIRGDAVADVPKHCRVLMQRVHAAEQAAVQASRTGSRRMAIEALALHPLVDSVELAQRIVAGYMEHQPGLAAQLA